MDAKHFSTKLKELREEAELTQAGLADLAGLHQSAISLLEAGVRLPTWDTVLTLCIALNVSCEVFRPPADAPPKRGRPKKREDDTP